VPSARIVDVAETMIGDRGIELAFTGVRPGEKLHEILISDEEAIRTVERGGYYALQPMLPDFDIDMGPRPLEREFSSADAVVTGAELEELIAIGTFVDVAVQGAVSPGQGRIAR